MHVPSESDQNAAQPTHEPPAVLESIPLDSELPTAPLWERIDGDSQEPATVSSSVSSSAGGLITDGFPVSANLAQRFVQHEQLGRGGFGSVYRAYDRQLDRFVAIKVPHINSLNRERIHKRVAREATATARLRHPNIVTLFDFIRTDDHSLLVNELIEGETLTQLIKKHPGGCDFRVAAAIVQRIASAVQHAHDQSVLHRDIKPSNIMLDKTQVDGELPYCPRLTDFGLATILRDSDSEGQSEIQTEAIGTWHYTPPEMIRNNFDGHTPTCDIYSLGVVLYELIAGTRPFQAATLADLLPKVCNGDFLSPRAIRNEVPRDLEAICLRCMARNPSTRYPTAASLSDDLLRFLAGEIVLARLPDRSERFFRWIRRNPTPAAIAAVSALALVVVFIVIAATNRQLFKLNSELESMNTQLQTALSTTRKTLYEYEQSNYVTDLANASNAIRQSHLRDARTLLSRYSDAQPLSHHRDIEWDHNRHLISKSPTVLWKSDRPLYYLCEAGDFYCTAGAASEIVMIDRTTGATARTMPTWQKDINSLVFDAEHDLIWSSGDDGSIHAYDFQKLKQTYNTQAFDAERAYDMASFPELKRIACLSSHGSIAILDTTSGKVVGYLEKFEHEATSIARVDSHRIAVGDKGGRIRIFDVSSFMVDHEMRFEDSSPVGVMARDPVRDWLWILIGNTVRILNLETMRVMQQYKTSDEAMNIAHNAADQSTVIALRGGVFHRFHATDDAELIEVDQWVNEGQRIYYSTFDTQSGNLLTVGASGDVLTWKPRPLARTEFDAQAASPMPEGVYSFQLVPGPSGQWPVVVVEHFKTLFRLDTETASLSTIGFADRVVRKFAVIDEHRLAIPNQQSAQSIFDQRSNAFTKLPIPSVNGFSFVLAGHWLADTDIPANLIRVVDLQDPRETLELNAYNPTSACIAPRNRKIFWNSNNSVMVRSLDVSEPETVLEIFSRNPWLLHLSPDESLLAIGLSDREVYLWDWRGKKRVGPVMMHEGQVHAIAFSPGGRTLLSIDDSATLRFWNITTGQQVSQTNLGISPDSVIKRAKFTPDGSFIVVLHDVSKITTVRIR